VFAISYCSMYCRVALSVIHRASSRYEIADVIARHELSTKLYKTAQEN
jgi:hypothetical protein